MVALGLVMLVLAALLTLGIVFSNTDPSNAAAFGVSLSNVSIGGLFLVGVITGAIAMLGLTVMLGGSVRRRHKRVQAKQEVRTAHGEADALAQENARLAGQLQEQGRSDRQPPTR
ncbi:MAG: hypothetical protein JWN57_1364 [Frankiales bacterium]|nr:hypothetical protein [Frankiales bacterium]